MLLYARYTHTHTSKKMHTSDAHPHSQAFFQFTSSSPERPLCSFSDQERQSPPLFSLCFLYSTSPSTRCFLLVIKAAFFAPKRGWQKHSLSLCLSAISLSIETYTSLHMTFIYRSCSDLVLCCTMVMEARYLMLEITIKPT